MKYGLLVAFSLVVCCVFACRTTQDSVDTHQPQRAAKESEAPDPSSAESAESVESEAPSIPSCEPLQGTTSIPARTSPEFDAFRKKVKSLGKKVAEESGRQRWSLQPTSQGSRQEIEVDRVGIATLCSAWVGQSVPKSDDHQAMGSCNVEFQLDGAVATIEYIVECSSDGCSVRHYVWRRDTRTPVEVGQPADFVNVVPGGEFVYFSAAGTAPVDFYTYRSRLDGRQVPRYEGMLFSSARAGRLVSSLS